MIPIDETAAVLLCAGLSQRFGDGNKLRQPLEGRPLVSHAATVLASLPFARRIAVVGRNPLRDLLPDFETVRSRDPAAGQDRSVRIGIKTALQQESAAVLICLGDMPFVTSAHLVALAAAADEVTAAISSAGWRSPPLLLPVQLARQVLLQPGQPVRGLLAGWRLVEVPAPSELLRDFDTRADFAQP